MFATQITFGTKFMFGTNLQLFLLYCAKHKLENLSCEHNFVAEHIVPKLNGDKVRIFRLTEMIFTKKLNSNDFIKEKVVIVSCANIGISIELLSLCT